MLSKELINLVCPLRLHFMSSVAYLLSVPRPLHLHFLWLICCLSLDRLLRLHLLFFVAYLLR